jgi:hypothetical protein
LPPVLLHRWHGAPAQGDQPFVPIALVVHTVALIEAAELAKQPLS